MLIHGFTGAPDEMRGLGEALAADGFPVRGVRLPGHGTTVEDLAQRRLPEWVAEVEGEAGQLAAEVPNVAVVGLSMGGLLALHLAATRPAAVSALVLFATAIELRPWAARLVPWAARVPAIARRYRLLPKSGRRDIADPVARRESFTYGATPLAGVVELLRLQRVVRAELAHVTQPALLVHGRHDHTVPVSSLDRLARGLGSTWIEAHVLERSCHVLTLDLERRQLVDLTAGFLARVEAQLRI